MTTASQGMSVQEIEQIVAKRVANAIEVIAIYESINQAKQRENKVAGMLVTTESGKVWDTNKSNCSRKRSSEQWWNMYWKRKMLVGYTSAATSNIQHLMRDLLP
ncbi:hypothetical protein Tco_0990825 [Tanacetum coccineum]|uniref:Uncharacterized protein n=1 Tax=Tanacetum coccineum TaxID=301880 RepID=A0ABQ5EXK3_9ASTR